MNPRALFTGFEPIPTSDRRWEGEREILSNRLVMGSLALIVCWLAGISSYVIAAFSIYLSCNALLMLGRRTGMKPQLRWISSILLDATMAAVAQILEPAQMSFAWVIMMWAVLGNGFRFGNRWLFLAAGAMAVSFATVVAVSPFWHDIPVLAAALLAGLLVLPAYCSTLIAKLSRATEQATAANRAKSYFLASVSHELRTPLNAIIGYATQLEEENLSPRIAAMVGSSHKAAEHLLYLIEQLLYASRSESMQGPVSESPYTLPDLVAQTRDILIPQAQEKGIDLHVHAAPGSDQKICGPAEMVRNMMLNLASNAIKFTAEGQVVIECGIAQAPDGPELWFAVEDSGVGIAPEAQQRIFEPFVQADESVLDRFGGTGLGLAICRQFADRMGGVLSVESEPGVGSRFTYRGPASFVQQSDSEEESAETEAAAIIHFGGKELENSDARYRIDLEPCADADDLRAALKSAELQKYDIAVIDEAIANMVSSADPLWQQFIEARTPAVLQSADRCANLEDIALRAAFATVIPAQPDFNALRSAIRIGCSFRGTPPSDRQAELAPAAQILVSPRRVLVADDNRTNREVLKTILESIGHEVHFAVDGEEALEALENLNFDIVLLDVNMPKLSGIEVCALWRQIEGPRQRLPILGLTADATDETAQKCLDAGMDARFTKPMRRGELIRAMEQFCPEPEGSSRSAAPEPGKLMAVPEGLSSSDSVLDPAQIESLLEMGGTEFLESLCLSYCEDVEQLIVDLERAANQQELEAFCFAAHAIKSSAANIGASDLRTLCGRLETIAAPEFQANGVSLAETVKQQARLVEEQLSAMTAGAIRAA